MVNTIQQQQNPQSIVVDLAQLKESTKLINNAFNKSCKGGLFTMDEAYLIKVACTNIEKLIEFIEASSKKIN